MNIDEMTRMRWPASYEKWLERVAEHIRKSPGWHAISREMPLDDPLRYPEDIPSWSSNQTGCLYLSLLGADDNSIKINDWGIYILYSRGLPAQPIQDIGCFTLPTGLRSLMAKFLGDVAVRYLGDPVTIDIGRYSRGPQSLVVTAQYAMEQGSLRIVLERSA